MQKIILLLICILPIILAAGPQEKNCTLPQEKYFSVDAANGHCGECCMDPKNYNIFHIFEWNLTKATDNDPCLHNNYPIYDSTVTHGVWPLSMTLDLYNPQKSEKVEFKVEQKNEGPQEKNCTLPQEKYYSVDAANGHCGECCMDPKNYNVFHIFEWNLTKATDNDPCLHNNYPVYDSTVTHGVWPLSMTLDLYNPQKSELKNNEPCCSVCQEPKEKYHSVDTANGYCGECCMDPKQYSLFKIFERNLTKSTDNTPCKDFKYSVYSKTETHGFGPVSMTLDLYSPDQQEIQQQ